MGREAREEIGNQILPGLVGHCKDFSFTLRLKSERDWKPLGNLKQRNDVILWWDSGLFNSHDDSIK